MIGDQDAMRLYKYRAIGIGGIATNSNAMNLTKCDPVSQIFNATVATISGESHLISSRLLIARHFTRQPDPRNGRP